MNKKKFYGEKINGIFLDLVVYILFHECCHLVNGHCDFIKAVGNKDISQLTQSEREEYKALENEADLFAIESLIKSTDNNKYKLVKGLSIVLANISLLFIVEASKTS